MVISWEIFFSKEGGEVFPRRNPGALVVQCVRARLHVPCLCVACVGVWSWLALQFALQDLKTALIAMPQVYTHCLYGAVWCTTSACVAVSPLGCARFAAKFSPSETSPGEVIPPPPIRQDNMNYWLMSN